MANAYLDIDGVLLANDLNAAKHVHEFIEKAELIKHGVFDNWIEVDLANNEDQLANFVSSFPLPVSSA